jgi:hypothetical protein
MLMPKDTNALGTIFGGIILSYIDLAGAIEAYRHVHGQVVTVAMDKVEFHQPVFVGDIVSLYCTTRRIGTSSITIHVLVEAERRCSVTPRPPPPPHRGPLPASSSQSPSMRSPGSVTVPGSWMAAKVALLR